MSRKSLFFRYTVFDYTFASVLKACKIRLLGSVSHFGNKMADPHNLLKSGYRVVSDVVSFT